MNPINILVLLLILAFVTPSLATGRVQPDWTAVQALSGGTRVVVYTKSKRSYSGETMRVTETELVINENAGGQERTIPRTDVGRVYRLEKKGSRGKSIGIWSAIGFGIGAGIGAAILGATGGSDETGKVLAPFLIGGAAAGAAVGAAIGKGEKKILIYEFR